MEALEKIRSIFSIIRDFLVIVFIIVLIMLGVTAIGFISSLDSENISCENVVNTVMSGDLGPILGEEPVTESIEPTQEMLALVNEIEASASAGDTETALQKIGELKAICASKGYGEAVSKLEDLKNAINEENYVKALGAASQLKKMFGQ